MQPNCYDGVTMYVVLRLTPLPYQPRYRDDRVGSLPVYPSIEAARKAWPDSEILKIQVFPVESTEKEKEIA